MLATQWSGRPVARLAASAALVLAVLFQTSCGTVFYPERRGQPSGKIDPAVAILNGIGLLLFIIPGLIAFAVDFSTGAIYLPPEEVEDADAAANEPAFYIDPENITPETLAEAIYEHTGVKVDVTEEHVRALRRQDAGPISEALARELNRASE